MEPNFLEGNHTVLESVQFWVFAGLGMVENDEKIGVVARL